MEKLTLKELAPYLPYSLMVLNLHTNVPYQLTGRVIDRVANLNESHKPILRPLSDLTKEIEHNGKKFVPIEWLLDNRDVDAEYDFISALEDDWAPAQDKIIFAPFSIAQKLIEWKFDVFGLEKGLAVPVTEEFNPYK